MYVQRKRVSLEGTRPTCFHFKITDSFFVCVCVYRTCNAQSEGVFPKLNQYTSTYLEINMFCFFFFFDYFQFLVLTGGSNGQGHKTQQGPKHG